MKKISTIILLVIFVIGFCISSANASLINDRPYPGIPAGGVLQSFFNIVGQSIDVYADQSPVAIFNTTGDLFSRFTIELELSANAQYNTMGIYNYTSGTTYQLFSGEDNKSDWTRVMFNYNGVAGDTMVFVFEGDTGNKKSQTLYHGVESNSFGFYIQTEDGSMFYTEDSKNPGGNPQALVYEATNPVPVSQYWICFDDVAFDSSDRDYDDFVIFACSVGPTVPEPATLLLLGSGLLGMGVFARRRFKK